MRGMRIEPVKRWLDTCEATVGNGELGEKCILRRFPESPDDDYCEGYFGSVEAWFEGKQRINWMLWHENEESDPRLTVMWKPTYEPKIWLEVKMGLTEVTQAEADKYLPRLQSLVNRRGGSNQVGY